MFHPRPILSLNHKVVLHYRGRPNMTHPSQPLLPSPSITQGSVKQSGAGVAELRLSLGPVYKISLLLTFPHNISLIHLNLPLLQYAILTHHQSLTTSDLYSIAFSFILTQAFTHTLTGCSPRHSSSPSWRAQPPSPPSWSPNPPTPPDGPPPAPNPSHGP